MTSIEKGKMVKVLNDNVEILSHMEVGSEDQLRATKAIESQAKTTPFRWDWTIILISVFLSVADFVYFYALSYDDSMISIVSMIRRGSVIVSFTFGALFFREKNLKSKAIDLILVLIGMIFLYLGSKS